MNKGRPVNPGSKRKSNLVGRFILKPSNDHGESGANLELPALIQALMLARNPAGFFEQLGRGRELFEFRVPGIAIVHATGSSAVAKQIFAAPPGTFAPIPNSPIEPLLGPNSMMILDGQRHARERRLMMPCFGPDKIAALATRMIDVTKDEIARLPEGVPIDLNQMMQRITLSVIVDVIFGMTAPEEKAVFIAATEKFLAAYTPSLMLIQALRNPRWPPWRRFLSAQKDFDNLVQKKITERSQRLLVPSTASEELEAQKENVCMLGILQDARMDDGAMFSHDELRDELRTLLVAGHETGATSLTWAMFHTLKEQSVHRRLKDEIKTARGDAETLNKLPFLGAVCQEALRIEPVVPIAVRALKAPLTLAGRTLPAGDNVAVVLTLLHRNENLYPDPARFDPDRFLKRRFETNEFAPFGGGFRRCIGAAFAQTEMRMVLGALMSHAEFELITRRPPLSVARNITVGPKDKIWIQRPTRHRRPHQATGDLVV